MLINAECRLLLVNARLVGITPTYIGDPLECWYMLSMMLMSAAMRQR